jgi:hypothetical protein
VSEPRAFLAVDLGSATTAVSIVGRIDGRWRLLGSLSVPASVPDGPAGSILLDRIRAADPFITREVGLPDAPADLPRLVARTVRPPRIAVLAATGRALAPLAAAAERAGWAVTAVSASDADPLVTTRLLLRRDVRAVLIGAGEPPGADERATIPDLAAAVAAAAVRRPELAVILAGALAERPGALEGLPNDRPGGVILAAGAAAGEPAGSALAALLDDIRAEPDDGRRLAVRTAGALAHVLERRVEVVEIGASAGLRVSAMPEGARSDVRIVASQSAVGALVPDRVDDALVEGVLAWSTLPLDRHRLRDRLRELEVAPWGEAHGEGALLRLAVARAALARLVAATSDAHAAIVPDIVVVAGGAWAAAPGSAVALAVSDVLRRAGAMQLAFDHARLLGPLGAIPDDDERRLVLRDLVDDVLAPLGSVVLPGGLRSGRSVGRLVVHAGGGTSELDLVPGGLELVDLPPGETAIAEFRFRDPVVLGARGRHFALDVTGGLGGLLVDLRDVPLRLPDRHERRRELLEAWQRSLWAGIDA